MLQLLLVEPVTPRAPNARRHIAEQLLDERTNVRLHLAIEQVRSHQTDAAVGDDEAVGDEVMVSVPYREIVDLAGEVADWLDRDDALPHHASPWQSVGGAGAELLEGGKVLADARGVFAPRVQGPLDETPVNGGEEPLHDLVARDPGSRQRGDLPSSLVPLSEPALLVLEVLHCERGEPGPFAVVLVADTVPQVEEVVEHPGEDEAQSHRRLAVLVCLRRLGEQVLRADSEVIEPLRHLTEESLSAVSIAQPLVHTQ